MKNIKKSIQQTKDERITLRASKTLKAQLQQLSKKRGLALSKVIRALVESEYLNEFK